MAAPVVATDHWPWLSILGLLGGLAGALTLAWRVADYLRSYIKLELTAEQTDTGSIKLRTVIENPNISAKALYGVFLIVGPANESPGETVRALFKEEPNSIDFGSYNEMVRATSERIRKDATRRIDASGRSLIPLPYYYRENVRVADESLSFEVILAKDDMPPGIYSARLYLDAQNRLHRVVQAAFDFPATADPTSGFQASDANH